MSIARKYTVDVQGVPVSFVSRGNEDFISLTDLAKYKNPDHADDVIRNWLRNRNTIEFLGIWERLNNLDFNPVEFDGIRFQSGLNSFTLTPRQWIEKTRAAGIVSRAGRHVRQQISLIYMPQQRKLRRNFLRRTLMVSLLIGLTTKSR